MKTLLIRAKDHLQKARLAYSRQDRIGGLAHTLAAVRLMETICKSI